MVTRVSREQSLKAKMFGVKGWITKTQEDKVS